ncbi:hypothetical protein BOTBODRAFT_109818 [Botryobasidium botryosum FD-172 SS1]|uniref:Golgi apparatus membrane protein TVP38 n=1 Tax=Botryobasidium botryosum (strain FD-172 SS1) TaxID=930990 RepID=A0A067MFZ4_BOTB1|nr:hypothetical protein BOTBODRAFT_109818 [Botryobasidium botryosum FD-172 SS1]
MSEKAHLQHAQALPLHALPGPSSLPASVHSGRPASTYPYPPPPPSSSYPPLRFPPSLKPWSPMGAWCITTIGFLCAIAFWKSELFHALDDLSDWLKDQGAQGYAVLGFLIFLTTFPPLPLYSTLIILSGYTYGAVPGAVLSFTAALSGAIVVFILARRYLSSALCLSSNSSDAFVSSITPALRAIERRPILLVLVRLAPYPYNVLNALLGARSSISLTRYTLCTAISLLKVIIHTGIGSQIKNFSEKDRAENEDESGWGKFWTVGGILLCVALFVYISYVARRAVDDELAHDGDSQTQQPGCEASYSVTAITPSASGLAGPALNMNVDLEAGSASVAPPATGQTQGQNRLGAQNFSMMAENPFRVSSPVSGGAFSLSPPADHPHSDRVGSTGGGWKMYRDSDQNGMALDRWRR